jgi:plasmid stability protein
MGVADSALAEFVAGLAPDSAAVSAPGEEMASFRAGLPAGAARWAVALGRRCADATRIAQGEHAARLAEDDTRHAIEGSMLGLLRRLHGDEPGAALNEWQLAIARTMAGLDWPYERYLLGLRLAQDMALEALLDRAVRWGPADSRPSLLLAVTRGVAAYFDDSVRAVIAEFIAEHQRAFARSAAERRRVVAALIAGEEVPADVAAAALGIDLTRHHLALLLWRRGSGAGGTGGGTGGAAEAAGWSRAQLELAASRAAGRLRAPATLTLPADEAPGDVRGDALLCWLASPVPFPGTYLDRLSELFAASGEVGAAVGVPGRGPAGFRRSYLASVDAYRVARAAGRGSVTGYAEVGALALLSADRERARWFAAEELGRLAGQGAGLDDLRETALCYLDSGRNLMDTARRLHVHRNTVVYRLAKIQRLLGRPVGERAFATQAALALATLGGAV